MQLRPHALTGCGLNPLLAVGKDVDQQFWRARSPHPLSNPATVTHNLLKCNCFKSANCVAARQVLTLPTL